MSAGQATTFNSDTSNSSVAKSPIRVGILGFGGLGQAASRVLTPKTEMLWVAAADQKGYVYTSAGLSADQCIKTYQAQGSVGYLEAGGTLSNNSIADLIQQAEGVDGYFVRIRANKRSQPPPHGHHTGIGIG